MSTANDNIFTRWSRRKQAVRDSETPALDQEESAFDGTAAETGGAPAEQQIANAGPHATEPAEPLPLLEDLTAESDLSAFLRSDVPEALRSAALRKAWSLDPAIRDYIGPSEYAWDFNQPGSMAGFGPLDAGKAAVEFLANMSSGRSAGPTKAVAAPVDTGPRKANPASPNAEAEPDKAAMTPPDRLAEPSHVKANRQSASSERVTVAKFEEADNPAELSGTATRPRHGGAIPR